MHMRLRVRPGLGRLTFERHIPGTGGLQFGDEVPKGDFSVGTAGGDGRDQAMGQVITAEFRQIKLPERVIIVH